MGGGLGGLKEGCVLMSLTPKCDTFLESAQADQTGNVGKVGNVGKAGIVGKFGKVGRVG